MIYQMCHAFIDLSKLEYVSHITNASGNYTFIFQINGEEHSIEYHASLDEIIQIKDDLIKAWKEYKEQR